MLKNGPFGGLVTKIADVLADPSSLFLLRRLEKADKGTAILIGTPCHHNLGDHLIASNEKSFLIAECSFAKVIEIPTRIFLHNKLKIKKCISTDLPIFITGGGWMGDLWPEDQKILEAIVSSFEKNDVIVLPQTVYYSDFNSAKNAIAITKSVFARMSSLTIFCRDQLSYDTVLELYKSSISKVLLCPDIGLYREPIKSANQSRIIRCCLRNDRELTTDSNLKELIDEFGEKNGYEVMEDSTIAKKPVSVWEREGELNSLINRFHCSALIVTDRLHGMVFSSIANTKCIAFDNKTHKVSGVYKLWLKDNPKIRLITSSDNQSFVKAEMLALLDSKPDTESEGYYSELKRSFTDMASEIVNITNKRKV